MSDINTTLAERGQNYGDFSGCASIAQQLKAVIAAAPGYAKLSPSQRESLDMIASKFGRILNGDPNYVDSWHDAAGYALLVEQELTFANVGGDTQ